MVPNHVGFKPELRLGMCVASLRGEMQSCNPCSVFKPLPLIPGSDTDNTPVARPNEEKYIRASVRGVGIQRDKIA